MQRHKRWLIITVWVSTIAFVGAGFVGWGSYSYGSSGANVATVGDKEVKISDLQSEYNSLYNNYMNMFGDSFNQEMAKQFKLEEIAYKNIVQKFLLLNYADDLGLYVTDKEVAKYLVEVPSFLKDGKFDKSTYLSVLKRNRTNPTDFEQQVKNDILISKIQTIFNSSVTSAELNNLTSLNSMQDKVSIKIINKNDISVEAKLVDIKSYWEGKRENYKSLESYKIAISKVKIDDKDNKKKIKKEALKKYLKLKKNELKFDKTLTIDQNSDMFIFDTLEKIFESDVGTILKPIEEKNNFVIVKLIEKYPSEILPFKDVSKLVRTDYISYKKQELLQDKVNSLTNKFSGKDIGFVSQNTELNIKGLTKSEVQQLTTHILRSSTTINSIILDDKAVVYKITDSRLVNNNNSNNDVDKKSLQNIKNNEIISSLLKQLENRYETISNMKAN
jgi:peptidyl-prolyl cis-trans isomerase D